MIIVVLTTQVTNPCPIAGLNSRDEIAQLRHGHISRDIVGQTHEMALVQDCNLHRGGRLHLGVVIRAVVLAVVTGAETDGDGVPIDSPDLDSATILHGCNRLLHVCHYT